MHVDHLSLLDFRSWARAELPLRAGVTSLVGPNGQGKTNLVEALGYVAGGSSHRVSSDAPLVRAGAERAVLRASVVRDGRHTLVELEINPGRANRARLNRVPLPRAREALGVLRTVLFAPEDLALVKGDPEGRRRFLDDLVVARSPRMAGVRADVDRVLRQRGALLRSGALRRRRGETAPGDPDALHTLEVWDAHLATVGAELVSARLALLGDLAGPVAAAYEEVSAGQGDASVTYRSSLGEDLVPDRQVLAAALLASAAEHRRAEIERGVSLVGPHRDDLVLTLGGMPAKGFASHGESWSFALALRLASYDLLRADSASGDGEPVLVLDDVFAELDVGRRDRLARRVGAAEQVLVTAAVPDDVPTSLRGDRVDVDDGQAVRRER